MDTVNLLVNISLAHFKSHHDISQIIFASFGVLTHHTALSDKHTFYHVSETITDYWC